MIFYLNLFLLGLASSFHCMTMCGPIAMALPLNRSSNMHLLSGVLSANFGRLITYTSLGLIFGVLGFSFGIYRFFQIASIFFGVALIILAWRRHWINKLEVRNSSLNNWTSKQMGKLLKKKGNLRLFGIGLLNGLLPCGMILLALASSLLAKTPWESGLGMTFFGLGTLPGMLSVAFLAQKMGQSFRGKLSNMYPYLVTIIGILIILRGSNLGIPFVSPKIETKTSITHKTDTEMMRKQIMCHQIDSKEN